MQEPLLAFNQNGIYCAKADVYLDPWRKVDKAIISHGHADHSRWGNKKYITHHDNIPIMKHRLGEIDVMGKAYGESFTINNVKFSLHPAGHVIGSSQIRVEHQGEVWVFTGDYKDEDDGVCIPYDPVKCHTFITECTFGLPAFKWKPQAEVMSETMDCGKTIKLVDRTLSVFDYPLGKDNRILNHPVPTIAAYLTVLYTHHATPDTSP